MRRRSLTSTQTVPYCASYRPNLLYHVLPFRPETVSNLSLFSTKNLCPADAWRTRTAIERDPVGCWRRRVLPCFDRSCLEDWSKESDNARSHRSVDGERGWLCVRERVYGATQAFWSCMSTFEISKVISALSLGWMGWLCTRLIGRIKG